MQSLFRSIAFIVAASFLNIVQAANEISITLDQLSEVSVLKLQSVSAPDIIWVDENGDTTELPTEITSNSTTAFYGSDPNGTFDLAVIYTIEESGNTLGNLIAIDMDEQSCLINGKEEDAFTTQKYAYYVKAEHSPFVPDDVSCTISINIEQQNGQLPVIQLSIDNQSHKSTVPSEPPKHTGTLTQGSVTLGSSENNHTSCTSTNFSDCVQAASQTVTAENASPVFVFTADPTNWMMEGELRYVIQDQELNTTTYLIVTLQNGDTLLEQCVAEVLPLANGQINYKVKIDTLDTNHCKVKLNRTMKPLPNSPTMQLVINNQLEGNPGTLPHTFALMQNQVQVSQGIFNANPTDIPVNQTQSIVVSALYGANTSYQSRLIYSFDDYQMNSVPTGLQIELDNTISENTSDWCKAATTGWNEGHRLYTVATQVTGDATNLLCTVTITSVDNPNTPVSYGFAQIDALPTEGIRQWEHFVIDGQHYLAAANSGAKNIEYITQNIFRLDSNSNKFLGLNNLIAGYHCVDSSYNEILKDLVYGWQFFEVDGRKRLIMANHYTHPYKTGSEQQCDTTKINYEAASYLYDWQNGEFNIGEGCCDSIITDSSVMWEFYTHNGQSYLAVAELGLAGKSNASIYQWQSGKFVKMTQGDLRVPPTRFIEAFSVDKQTYLLFSSGLENQDTVMYRVESNGQLVLHQSKTTTPNQVLASEGNVINSRVFTMGNDTFLLLGFSTTHNAPVWLYRWEYVGDIQKSLFVPYQPLPENLNTAQAWTSFSANNKAFIAVILDQKRVVAYQWNTVFQQMEIMNAYPLWTTNDLLAGVTTFNVDQTPYLALAVQQDQNNNTRIKSPVLQWQQISP